MTNATDFLERNVICTLLWDFARTHKFKEYGEYGPQ